MKHLVKQARKKLAFALTEVRSRRDRRKMEREHRKIRAQLSRFEAILESRLEANYR